MTEDGEEAVAAALPGWLAETSEGGSGDDITVGLLVRRESMTEDARGVFLALVREHPDIGEDPRRFSGLLADRYEGRWRREAAALGAAVQEGVPGALRNGRGPFAALAAPLAARLVDERGFDAALARWAVDSWGIALDLTAETVVGGVRVVSEPPGAEVELDGRPLGPAPLLLPDVEPGKHALRCSLAGYVDRTARFEVKPGSTTTVRVRLEPLKPAPGTLQVRSVPPGAGIYVDSRYAGTTPVVVPLAGSGTVAIEAVGSNGLRYREERAVVAGADEILTIDLEAEAARQAARQRAAQEERAGHDFILFVIITMIITVIAAVLSAIFGGGSRRR